MEQHSTQLARLGKRLATTGLRHRNLSRRIAELEQRGPRDDVSVQRLHREQKRLEAEIQQYESTLMTVSDRKLV